MNNATRLTTAAHPESRMQSGGDLSRRPLTASQMAAPLTWGEQQLACVWRYGELADGTIGYLKVSEALAHGAVYRASLRP
jgi:hypothetical protein